jgi:hypothetical protein
MAELILTEVFEVSEVIAGEPDWYPATRVHRVEFGTQYEMGEAILRLKDEKLSAEGYMPE